MTKLASARESVASASASTSSPRSEASSPISVAWRSVIGWDSRGLTPGTSAWPSLPEISSGHPLDAHAVLGLVGPAAAPHARDDLAAVSRGVDSRLGERPLERLGLLVGVQDDRHQATLLVAVLRGEGRRIRDLRASTTPARRARRSSLPEDDGASLDLVVDPHRLERRRHVPER